MGDRESGDVEGLWVIVLEYGEIGVKLLLGRRSDCSRFMYLDTEWD